MTGEDAAARPGGAALRALGLFWAAVLLLVPGRTGYGAVLTLTAALAATVAHAASLGWDSAPPALAIAAVSAFILQRHKADLSR